MYESLRGVQSFWKPYLDILPHDFETPMFWTPEELAHLQASAILNKIGRPSAEHMIQTFILPVIRAHPHVFFSEGQRFLTDEELLALALRMGSAIMAYAFDLENDESEEHGDENDGWVEDREGRTPLGMVPLADVLNADAAFNVHISHGEGVLTATTLRSVERGEELLNYYGSLSSGELLRRYGYVTSKYAVHDVVELPWGLVENRVRGLLGVFPAGEAGDREWAKVTAFLNSEDIEDCFSFERPPVEPNSDGTLPLTCEEDPQTTETFSVVPIPEELMSQVKSLVKAGRKVKPQQLDHLFADKHHRDEFILQAIAAALSDREGQYGTSLEQDLQSVSSFTGKNSKEARRQCMALQVRIGEKRLLRHAGEFVQAELEKLRAKRVKEERGVERTKRGARGEATGAAPKRQMRC